MTNSLIHHRSFRTRRIYDGSIRRPRTGADDNKSVGLLVNADNAFVLMGGLARYLAWNTVRRIMNPPGRPDRRSALITRALMVMLQP